MHVYGTCDFNDVCATSTTFTIYCADCDDLYLFLCVRPIQELVNELGSNGAFTGTLAADSSNVVTLVRELYNVSHKTCS